MGDIEGANDSSLQAMLIRPKILEIWNVSITNQFHWHKVARGSLRGKSIALYINHSIDEYDKKLVTTTTDLLALNIFHGWNYHLFTRATFCEW